MKIEFDPRKKTFTLETRRLDMARAEEILNGRAITFRDERRDYGEERFITIGILDDRMVILVWTQRGDVQRIISLRKANGREKALYGARLDRS